MTDKPTAVVLPLPISTEQAQKMYEAYCSAFASSPETTRGSATTAALLTIGTPVAGGELEVIGYVSENSICLMTEQAARSIHLLREHERSFDTGLVRQSDAQAALAAAQAENVRLRENLTSCAFNLENVMTKMGDWCGENGPPEYLGPEEVMSAMDAYHAAKEALKGPAA